MQIATSGSTAISKKELEVSGELRFWVTESPAGLALATSLRTISPPGCRSRKA